jgi:hypothetical protein
MNRLHATVARLIHETRALPKLDRMLAAGLITGAAVYFQVGADWEIASRAGPLLAAPVVVSALLFGMDCGVASAAGAAALNWFIFVPPAYTLSTRDWLDVARIAVFVLIGLFAALVLNRAVARLRAG